MAWWTVKSSFPLPSAWNGDYSWGSRSHTHDPLATSQDGARQYCVWVDNNRHARIAKRTHGSGWGASVDLQAVGGSGLTALFELDEHNGIVVGVDPNERVHVAGNHHGDALRYMRTTNAGGDISAWTAPGMVGTQEDLVTYPVFFNLLDGTLMFLYRNGLAGTTGNTYLNSYNHGTNTWTRAKIIFDDPGNVTFYPHHVAVDQSNGHIHLIGTKRYDTTGNADIIYAKSANGGNNWTTFSGGALTFPMTDSGGELVVNSPGVVLNSPLNNGGMEIDNQGRPHAIFKIDDGSGPQMHHIYHNGTSWQNEVVLDFPVSRPAVVCMNDGAIAFIGRSESGGRSNVLRVWDITGGNVTEHVLGDVDLLNWEPAIDTRALYLRNEVYLISTYSRNAGPQVGDPADLGNQLNVPVVQLQEFLSVPNVQDIKQPKLDQEYSVTHPTENNAGALLQRYRDENNLERWEDYVAHVAAASPSGHFADDEFAFWDAFVPTP